MKKLTILLTTILFIVVSAKAQQKIELPKTDILKASDMSLMKALKERHSIREYSEKDISRKELSTLLWAALGINRPKEGRITAPSAINAQDIVIYVCNNEGAFKYEAISHSLLKVSDKDLRKAVAGRQDFAAKAPACLVLVSNQEKFPKDFDKATAIKFGALDAGYVSENICLTCTALGMATVPRASMDKETLCKELKLKDTDYLLLNHPIGYPQK